MTNYCNYVAKIPFESYKEYIGFALQQNDLLMNFLKTVIQNLVKYLPLYLYF